MLHFRAVTSQWDLGQMSCPMMIRKAENQPYPTIGTLFWETWHRSNDGIVKLNKVVKFTYGRFPFSLSKPLFLLNKKAKKQLLSRDGGVEHSPWVLVRLRQQSKQQGPEEKRETTIGTDFEWRRSNGREEPECAAVSLLRFTLPKRGKQVWIDGHFYFIQTCICIWNFQIFPPLTTIVFL
jgi:hypothetical protein